VSALDAPRPTPTVANHSDPVLDFQCRFSEPLVPRSLYAHSWRLQLDDLLYIGTTVQAVGDMVFGTLEFLDNVEDPPGLYFTSDNDDVESLATGLKAHPFSAFPCPTE
jgi:hypothetical protein